MMDSPAESESYDLCSELNRPVTAAWVGRPGYVLPAEEDYAKIPFDAGYNETDAWTEL